MKDFLIVRLWPFKFIEMLFHQFICNLTRFQIWNVGKQFWKLCGKGHFRLKLDINSQIPHEIWQFQSIFEKTFDQIWSHLAWCIHFAIGLATFPGLRQVKKWREKKKKSCLVGSAPKNMEFQSWIVALWWP